MPAKEARNKRIFDMWLACYSVEEIAERENVGKATVSEICSETANLPEANKPAASHQVDFDIPLYDRFDSSRADRLGKVFLPDFAAALFKGGQIFPTLGSAALRTFLPMISLHFWRRQLLSAGGKPGNTLLPRV